MSDDDNDHTPHYTDLSRFDPAPTRAQLESEQRLARKPAAPFTIDELIRAVGIRLGDLHNQVKNEMRAADRATVEACMAAVGEVIVEERKAMRAEFTAELERQVAALRIEFLQGMLNAERGAKLKTVLAFDKSSLIA